MFEFGDYVLYSNGSKREVGRVLRMFDDGLSAYVCYHEGCTAARTPIEMLKLLDVHQLKNLDFKVPYDITKLGYHRFDKYCPDYDPECCYRCPVSVYLV